MATIPTSLQPYYRNFEPHCDPNRGFPFFQKPNILGSFSVYNERSCYLNDRSMLQFVRKCPPRGTRLHLDLGAGYENVIRKTESARHEKLDHLLKFILANLEKIRNADGNKKILKPDVIAWRGLLRVLMTCPYEQKEGFCILATRYRGTVYLCAYETEKMKEIRQNQQTPSMMRIFSYGFKFEQYQQTQVRHKSPDTSVPVNEAEEFCCIFAGRLESNRLLYGAEMDGISEEDDVDLSTVDLNSARFVELKVNLRPTKPWQRNNFNRFKSRNWWSQCFLAGVQKIVVGERSDAGLVEQVYEMEVRELPRHASGHWNPDVCMRYLDTFLELVKTEMADIDCPSTVYRFDYDPQENQNVQVMHSEGPNKYSFLPDWYVSDINKLNHVQ